MTARTVSGLRPQDVQCRPAHDASDMIHAADEDDDVGASTLQEKQVSASLLRETANSN